MCLGSGAAERNQSASATAFSQTLNNAFSQNYGAQSSIYSNLTQALTPEATAANPEGFTPQELADLKSNAINEAGGANKSALQASGNARSTAGGNDLDSGITSAINAGINTNNATALGATESGIDVKNAELGLSERDKARTELSQIATGENSTGFANAANTAGENAFKEDNTIQQQKQQQVDSIISGGIGLATSALGGFANLDSTGSSSAGEQLQNFAGGFAS